MSTLSFWLMLLIEMRVGRGCLTGVTCGRKSPLRLSLHHSVTWVVELRRDNGWYLLYRQCWDNTLTDWHWLETELKSIQHGSDWCHVDPVWPCGVYVVISCQVRPDLSYRRDTRGSGQCEQLSVRSELWAVSDGVSQWVTGCEAASSTSSVTQASVIDPASPASDSCHQAPALTRGQRTQDPDMPSNDTLEHQTEVHGWRWAAGSRLFQKSLII